MYWTLDNRPPTVDEIIRQGAERVRSAVEAAIEKHDTPKIEIRCTEVHGTAKIDPRIAFASLQLSKLAMEAGQQDMNLRVFGRQNAQAAGPGVYDAFSGYGAASTSGLGQTLGGFL